MAFVNGSVPCNKHIVELVDIVKPVVREAVENVNKVNRMSVSALGLFSEFHLGQVKVWILFLIPRIEDGNNFGVSIQVTNRNPANVFHLKY